MDLIYQHVPKEFNSNEFWYDLLGDHRYDTSNFKGKVIGSSYIHVAQWLLACGLFAGDDSVNVTCLSEL